MSALALAFGGVSFGYGGVGSGMIIRGLDLSVPAGECLTLLGPSGCGKSTLLRLAAGLLKPSEGSVTSFGHPVTGPGTDRIIVFQEPRLLPWLRVLGNIGLAADITEDTAASYLSMLGLGAGVLRLWPKELSGGMAQRVALARALAVKPRVMLLDEPLGALDIATRMSIQVVLRRLWGETGCTSVLVTHDMEEAVFLGDSVVVLGVNGCIIGSHRPHPVPPGSMRSRDSAGFSSDLNAIRSLIASGSNQTTK